MPPVRLGRLVLRWCHSCQVPILNAKECGFCNNKTQNVVHTPPGDIRPAFPNDIEHIRSLVDKQFGSGCGDLFIPENRIMILNRAPDLDRLDEVIFDGEVQGAIKFDLLKQHFKFLPRLNGAQRFLNKASKGLVIVDDGAINPILSSSSVLAPGILEASQELSIGDEVLVLTKEHELLAVGAAFMSGSEMLELNRGIAVKPRWHADKEQFRAEIKNKQSPTLTSQIKDHGEVSSEISVIWSKTLQANKPELDNMVRKAKDFIKNTLNRFDLPMACSFSGGKDSLAVLMLLLEGEIKPKLFFVDTGLEFPETSAHVNDISKKFDLELTIGKHTNTFWDGLKYFGPPSKDYRWCCKTCKLGPTTRQIKEQFPNGVLMFIGQRRYESQQRSQKEMIWKNPWVPGQVGASPIQHWSALHIWLYLFRTKVPFNPLYQQGLERIGCWLCPASDLADFAMASAKHPDYKRWVEYLKDYSNTQDYTPFWQKAGLWRWRKMPKGIRNIISENNIILKTSEYHQEGVSEKNKPIEPIKIEEIHRPLELYLAQGYNDCKYGLSQEGAFNKELDLERISEICNIIGKVTFDDMNSFCTINDKIDIFPEGAIVVKGKNPQEIKRRMAKAREVIHRALECVGCGICIGRCEANALELTKKDGVDSIAIDGRLCTHCGKCLGPCPVINYNDKEEFEM
jgi:phosphoadenosine phosphosulfate reductase